MSRRDEDEMKSILSMSEAIKAVMLIALYYAINGHFPRIWTLIGAAAVETTNKSRDSFILLHGFFLRPKESSPAAALSSSSSVNCHPSFLRHRHHHRLISRGGSKRLMDQSKGATAVMEEKKR